MIPNDDRPVFIDTGSLIDHKSEAVVLPRHLILARELNAHRLAHSLRQKRSIIGDGIGAIDAVTAGAHPENDVHAFLLNAQQHRSGTSQWINRLRGRIDRRLSGLDVGYSARGPERSMHLIGIVVGRLDDLRSLPKLLINVL